MHRIPIVKSASLAGVSDLTVLAPIRPGLVPALDTVSYKTRVKRVLATLHAGRRSSHEFELARVLSDAVERVGRIHAVRIAVLEPQDQVLLAVTFDGAWDAYVRVIWQKVSRLLDLIFCNTVDYQMGWTSRFDVWGQWLSSRQVETAFLYATPDHSSADTRWLRTLERLQRQVADHELQATRLQMPSVEAVAYTLYSRGQDLSNLGRDLPLSAETEAKPLVFRQGLRALAGLYRLADMFPPGTEDGIVLHRAAQELLPEFNRMIEGPEVSDLGLARAQARFSEPLNWLLALAPMEPARKVPPLPEQPPIADEAHIQAGILQAYPSADHGLVLLVACKSRLALAALLRAFTPTHQGQYADLKPGRVVRNIALTLQGLRLAGLHDSELQRFPLPFTEGMAARAGLLGDVRVNHPARWRLPMANWHMGVDAPNLPEQAEGQRIAPEAVHAVLTLRLLSDATAAAPALLPARQQILADLRQALDSHPDIVPLSLQWTQRLRAPAPEGQAAPTREHFGYLDNQSDPVLRSADAGSLFSNQVHLGEALVGHAHAGEDAPEPPADDDFVARLMQDGSFLVLRKLRQDVAAFNEVLDQAVAQEQAQRSPDPLERAGLMAHLMGRWPMAGAAAPGEPLGVVRPPQGAPNDFVFSDPDEAAAARCPLHAHVRLANPRAVAAPEWEASAQHGGRPPRLFRRGMSYGPVFDPDESDAQKRLDNLQSERGLVFMAYNASLGEQFEVVQRWLTGGNSTGGYSGQSDPLLGLAEPGRPRVFRFDHAGRTVRMALDGDPNLLAEPRPLVRLEWGLYAFAPSLPALVRLAERAAQAEPVDHWPWSAAEGERQIDALAQLERSQGTNAAKQAWKAALEDTEAWLSYRSASLWAAIRERHGGALRTPYGVLIASRELVAAALADTTGGLSVQGYMPRLQRSLGDIYLGLDDHGPGSDYAQQSAACNAAIQELDLDKVSKLAEDAVADKLQALVADTTSHAAVDEALRSSARGEPAREQLPWSLTVDVRELTDELLARACEAWFGLRDVPGLLKRGGFRWTWQEGEPPSYPGHWMAPSRYVFQPHPGGLTEGLGSRHGAAARAALTTFLAQWGEQLQAPVTRRVLDTPPGVRDADLAARTISGAIMGLVPTIDGNLRRVFNDWLREGSFWSWRAELTQAADATARQAAADRVWAAFERTMMARASPDMVWRTAVLAHHIGAGQLPGVAVEPGDTVVLGLASATQEALVLGLGDLSPAFGGLRRPGGPTHACPGYSAALALMRGMVLALVGSPLPLRAGPAPLTLLIEGVHRPEATEGLQDTLPAEMAFLDFKRHIGEGQRALLRSTPALWDLAKLKTGETLAPAVHTKVWVIGDSWLANLPFDRLLPDLQAALRLRGVQVSRAFADKGRTLAAMASDAALLQVRVALSALSAADRPKALLVGGGGNDITQPAGATGQPHRVLWRLLNRGGQTSALAWNEPEAKQFIDGQLAGHYRKILDSLLSVTDLPLLLHGYDHPIPDGRALVVDVPLAGPQKLSGPWLRESFVGQQIFDTSVQRQVMRQLIERLNAMLAAVVAEYGDQVQHLKLTGVLAAQADFGDPDKDQNYQRYWDNELHPSEQGYELLAAVVAQRLAQLP